MSKFEPGQRVSFLYFGEKRKGTILKKWPNTDTIWVVSMDKAISDQVCIGEANMKRLKPRAKPREFWIVIRNYDELNQIDPTWGRLFFSELNANEFKYKAIDKYTIYYVREVRKK